MRNFVLRLLINFLKIVRPRVDADPGRVYVGKASELAPLVPVEVNGASVLVARVDDGFCAVENRCAHLPVPLEDGRIEDGTIVCPFHNSRYDLCTGENLDWTPGMAGVTLPRWSQRVIAMGRQPQGIQTFGVTVENDAVYVDVFVRGE